MLNEERDEFLGIQDTLKALADPIRHNITLLCFGEAFRFVVMIVILTLKQKDGMIIQWSIRKLTVFLMKKMYCRTIMVTELMVLET